MARALTVVDNKLPELPELLRAVFPLTGRAIVVGVTGSPGVGKSSLVGALTGVFRSRNLKVGVVAVDPSSVQTGGAILGDRIRMQTHAQDDGVFIRSLASRGQLGGLSQSAGSVIDVMDVAGMDVILVETVGTGQSEIEVAEIAAIRIVVVQPTAGDSIQALKAGILEIADLIVINKADLPGASACENELRQATHFRGQAGAGIELLKTVATNGEGVEELAEQLILRGQNVPKTHAGVERMRRLLINEACRQLKRDLHDRDVSELNKLATGVMRADMTLEQAARKLLDAGMFHRL